MVLESVILASREPSGIFVINLGATCLHEELERKIDWILGVWVVSDEESESSS